MINRIETISDLQHLNVQQLTEQAQYQETLERLRYTFEIRLRKMMLQFLSCNGEDYFNRDQWQEEFNRYAERYLVLEDLLNTDVPLFCYDPLSGKQKMFRIVPSPSGYSFQTIARS